jgi:hypothetical protein
MNWDAKHHVNAECRMNAVTRAAELAQIEAPVVNAVTRAELARSKPPSCASRSTAAPRANET